ncbi:MAG: 4-(cytidine 5'-diphospho)-2-C-methyl-D-erythritol kinase [Clostridia bacterium]|nr:4-(cytidine 5'-diphospho)-2-C-methyl-D-erythritol kinase [Clostridia bacterium]
MTVRVWAPAKVNLTLDVVGRREDGYHLLRSVMQTIDLYDVVTVSTRDDGRLRVTCNGGIPADEHNTATRAARLFCQQHGCPCNFDITVEKHIPSQAGMAGGSTDAAAVLVALNVLTGAGYTTEALCEMGAQIGADVPLCVHGSTVLCTGTGTELTPVTPLKSGVFVAVKPEGGVSTPEAYRLLDSAEQLFHPDTDGLCRALETQSLSEVAACMGNSFEKPLALPYTADIQTRLVNGGALNAILTGSGSTVFGLFADEETAAACADTLRGDYPQTFVCRPCDGAIWKILE